VNLRDAQAQREAILGCGGWRMAGLSGHQFAVLRLYEEVSLSVQFVAVITQGEIFS